MKALVLQENTKLEYKDIADPVIGDDECLVEVKYAGVCSSDFNRAYGSGAYFYPLVMGHEFSGEIVKIGAYVSKYCPGDKVVAFPLLPCKACQNCLNKQYQQCTSYDYYGSRRHGGFAQYISIKEWNLLKLPSDMSLKTAAIIEPIAVVFHAISRVEIKPDDKIVILGAGFIGLITAFILAKTCRHDDIILIDHDQTKLNFALQFGFTVICSKDNIYWQDDLIKSGGVEVVFEMCGAVETFKYSLAIAKTSGTIVWVGNTTGDVLFEKKIISSILRKELTIKGSWNSSFTHDLNDDWHKALDYAKSSSELSKLITHVIPLDKGETFFESHLLKDSDSLVKQQNLYIKAVFKV